jgi:hypothetical protein
MANESSSSSMPAHEITSVGKLSSYNSGKVFETELFDIYVARLVRKHIVQQFVNETHPVLIDEIRLIGEAAEGLQNHFLKVIPEWHMACRLAKTVITHQVRHVAKQRLNLHDIDDEAREIALESIYREDFEELFPDAWKDS